MWEGQGLGGSSWIAAGNDALVASRKCGELKCNHQCIILFWILILILVLVLVLNLINEYNEYNY